MDKTILNHNYQNQQPNILATFCAKAARLNGIIDLSIGDPDFTTPKEIIKEAFQQANKGMTHYSDTVGLKSLRNTICDYYRQQYSLNFNSSEVLITTGAEHGMYILLQAILEPGDEVIIPEPCFSPYIDQVEMAGAHAIMVPTSGNDGFKVHSSQIAKMITTKTKAIIVNSPNNPTGDVMDDEEMKELAQLAKDNNLLLISDEIYADYIMPGHHFTPLATYAPSSTVTINGMSKSFAMTGWRIGYMIGPSWLLKGAQAVNDAITFAAPTISQVAAEYALKYHDKFSQPITKELLRRLQFLEKEINALKKFKVSPIGGSIYAFVDIRQTRLSSLEFANQLLDREKILVIPGIAFGNSGEGFVRIAATQKMGALKEAVKRLQHFEMQLG